MCLSTKMSAKKKAEFEGQTEGWKVMAFAFGGVLRSPSCGNSKSTPKYKWVNENLFRYIIPDQPTYSLTNKFYPYGWHIWLNEEGAIYWKKEIASSFGDHVVVRIKFRKPVAYGWQCNKPCVVAKEMMILKEAA